MKEDLDVSRAVAFDGEDAGDNSSPYVDIHEAISSEFIDPNSSFAKIPTGWYTELIHNLILKSK